MINFIQSYEDFINESEKVNGIELNKSLSKKDFGSIVADIDKLSIGDIYIIWEPGMNEWQGYLKLKYRKGDHYMFVSTLQGEDIELDYPKDEIEDLIKNRKIINQK